MKGVFHELVNVPSICCVIEQCVPTLVINKAQSMLLD